MNKIILNLPPMIKQFFCKDLLNIPTRASSEYLRKKYQKEINRKYKSNSRKMRDCEKYLEIYRELYEWFENKKTYERSEDKKISQKPSIPYKTIDSIDGKLRKDIRMSFDNFSNFSNGGKHEI